VERLVLEMIDYIDIDDKVNHQYVDHRMLMIYDNYLNIQDQFLFICELVYLPGN
jgi:hypothetical protein